LVGQLTAFGALVFLSRHLGPDGFGRYSVLYSLLAFFAAPLTLGLNYIVVREANIRESERNRIFGVGYGLRLILASAGALAALMIIPLIGLSGISWSILIPASFGLFFALWQPSFRFSWEAPFESDRRMDIAASVNLAGRIVLLGFLGLGIIFGAELAGMISLQAAGEIAAATLIIIALWRAGYPVRPRFYQRELMYQFKEAIPLIAVEALIILQTRSDILILNHLRGETAAGLFASPLRLVDALILFPTILVTAALPAMSRLAQKDREAYERLLSLLFKLLLAGGTLAAVLGSFLSREIVRLAFGAQYKASAEILMVLVWSAPFFFINAAWRATLVAVGQQHRQTAVIAALAAVNILANLLLIPALNGVGAAWAKVITFAALYLFALAPISVRREGLILIHSTLLPITIAIGITFILIRTEFACWWMGILLSVILGAAAHFSGWLGKTDIKYIFSAMSQIQEKR